MFKPQTLLALCAALLLTACGGGSGDVVGGGAKGPGTVIPDAKSLNTFFPMNFLEQGGEEYQHPEPLFATFMFSGNVHGYLLAPVNASTLLPAVNPSINDFTVTVHGQEVGSENAPILQKVEDLPVRLNTAIIVDTSASANAVDLDALKAAITAYLNAAAASSNPAIKNQRFTLWTANNTSNVVQATLVEGASLPVSLLSVNPNSNNSAINQTIVAAIGHYNGPGDNNGDYDFYTDAAADLIDSFSKTATRLNSLELSSVVVLAAGKDSMRTFFAESVKKALNWQSLIVFGKADEGEDFLLPGTKYSGKPLYYVELGQDEPNSELEALAKHTIKTNSWNTFNFAAELVRQQEKDVEERAKVNNLYMLRFPIQMNSGKFDVVLASNAANNNVTLTSHCDTAGTPATCTAAQAPTALEIAGPNNVYLPNGQVSVSKVKRLYPHVLWDPRGNHKSTTPTWTATPASPALEIESDGSVTISSANIGQTITLSKPGLTAVSITVVN